MLILTYIRTIVALIVIAAIAQQLTIQVSASYSVVNFFSYFTNLSNLFAAFVMLLSVFGRSSSANRLTDLLRYVSAVNMTIVGVVFAVLLRDVDLGALRPWINFVLHYVMPVAVVLDWLVKPAVEPLHAKHLFVALVFPAIYLAYVVLRGASTQWYPYPFLNPTLVGGAGGVAAYAIGIAVTFVLAAWILLVASNRASSPKLERMRGAES